LDAYQLPTGTIIVREPPAGAAAGAPGVALYARVSSAGQQADAVRQLQRRRDYAAARGYPMVPAVAEVASGLNEERPNLTQLLTDPRVGVLVGPMTREAFTNMRADVAIMGAGGITLEGVTNSHALLIDIQQAMLEAAQKIIFCLDHTKFGRQSVSRLCGLDMADVIVTDSQAPQDLVNSLRERGVEVIVAPNVHGDGEMAANKISK